MCILLFFSKKYLGNVCQDMWNSAGNNLKIGKEIIINTARRSKPLITLTQRGKAKVRRDVFVKFKGELPVRGFFQSSKLQWKLRQDTTSSCRHRGRRTSEEQDFRQAKTIIILQCIFFFLFTGRGPATWPAINCLQIMVFSCAEASSKCVLLQIIFCSYVIKTMISSKKMAAVRE